MLQFLTRFAFDDEGATAIEYGLIAALVSISMVAALQAMGTSVRGVFSDTSTAIDSVVSPAAP
jgi:pilus assembly protein Flp/PilA